MMRFALISDLHGNEVALQAVFKDIDRRGVEQTICLGDVATLGPRPSAILELLQQKNCPCILGNHDEFLIDPELIRTYTEVPIIVEAVDWCRSRLSADELAFVGKFQRRLQLAPAPRAEVLLFHGTPRSNMEDLLATTAVDTLDEMLAGARATVMAGGHTHLQMMRQHHGVLLVNPGSTGMPFKEYAAGKAPTLLGHAEYATIEVAPSGAIDVTLHRVEVDKTALRRSIIDSQTPLKPMLLAQYS